MQKDKSYIDKPFHLGKIDTDADSLHLKNKYRRTHGWDCPYQDYGSNRHYNTQRHINLTHGYGSGEPIDHMTGETREEKKRAYCGSLNQSRNVSVYRNSRTVSPAVRYPDNIASSVSPNPVRMTYLEAQEVRVKELGYSVGAQPPIRYLPYHSGSAGWGNAMNPPYRKNPNDFTRNKAVPYSSNATGMNEPYHPLEASFSPNNGPLAVSIRILLDSVILRKCFR
jgi:hypothetical protein